LAKARRSAGKSSIRSLISRSLAIPSSACSPWASAPAAGAFRRRQLPLLYRTNTIHYARLPTPPRAPNDPTHEP
jgi:hypothetical protein